MINYSEVAIVRCRAVRGGVGARPDPAPRRAGLSATPRPPPPRQARPRAEAILFFVRRSAPGSTLRPRGRLETKSMCAWRFLA